jgi:hypothetical protein
LLVEREEAAALLADPVSLRFLSPFVGHERSLTDAARSLGVSLNRLKYRVKRLTDLGLLRETHADGRRTYRAVADVFFVPFRATSAETAEALLMQWDDVWRPAFYANFVRVMQQVSFDWGVRVESDGRGSLRINLANRPERPWDFFSPDAPTILDGWLTDLHLEPEDAKAFLGEAFALYLRYAGRGGSQRYMTRVSFAPVLNGDEPPLP